MHFNTHEKTAVLIDGPNLWSAAQGMRLDIDWGRLQHFFRSQTMLASCIYFTPSMTDQEDGFQPLRKLLDWLAYNSWQVVAREKDTDVDLAVMAMELAEHVDHFIIGSGDSDFVKLVEALQRRGCRVTVMSALTGGTLSDDLRRAADDFLDLEAIRAEIQRDPRKLAVTA